ncbi:hypothetical protein RhoFasK5_03745|nr:hypothetical protein [Rhodococcus kroppenstedtii]
MEWVYCSRSRTVRSVSTGTRVDNVPLSGFASTAITRSPRTDANVDPSAAATVVLPTPPLRDSTATR